MTVLVALIAFGAGGVVGLLVGRRNPSIAAAVAKVAADAKAKVDSAGATP